MRLTAILLLGGVLHASATGTAQTVTLTVENMPLDKVCKEIERQTGYYFVYATNLNDKTFLINLEVKEANIQEALNKVFTGLPFTYQVIDKVIVINTLKNNVPPPGKAAADTNDVRGRVVNKQFEPLANASVVSVKTKKATTTDVNGTFRLSNLPANDELLVTYTGYKPQRVKITKQNIIPILMEVAENDLDKVVVQAYGTTSRRLTTSNIGVISSKEIEKQPTMNPVLTMMGRVAGLEIAQVSGYESAPAKIEIRGRNSVNSNFSSEPLIIVDGVPLTVLDVGEIKGSAYSSTVISKGFDQTGMLPTGGQSPLFSLSPTNIESIEVLKDADATAIYGSRGANGVILISTKKGRPGKNTFGLNISQGVNFVVGRWEMLDTKTYLAMRREAFKNDGIIPTATNAPDLVLWDSTRYTDWQDYLWGHTGKWTRADASLSGGTSQTSYRIGASYNRSSDITVSSGATQRASLSFNINSQSMNQRFKISLSGEYSYTTVDILNVTGTPTLAPNAPSPRDSAGNLNFAGWGTVSYPFSSLLWPNENKTKFLTSNVTLSYSIVKGLQAKASIGYNSGESNASEVFPIAAQNPNSSTKPTGRAGYGTTRSSNYIIEPQIEYNGLLGGSRINVLVGGTLQSNTTAGLKVNASGYTSDVLLGSLAVAPTVTSINYAGMYKYAGVFARIGYNYENRYIVNLNARRDGSSRFGKGNQFGNFGSLGVAWILSDENWMKNLLPSWMSFVKLRGSYGLTGSDGVGDYKYLSQWGNDNNLSLYNGVTPLTPQILENPDFHWQVNKKLEGSLAIGFLDDRINIDISYYRNRCNNQLVSFPLSTITGFQNVVANSPANVQNSGLEVTLNGRVVESKHFSWTIDFNVGINRNKLIDYPHLNQSPYYSRYKIGQSLDLTYVYRYTGIDPLTGQHTYLDFNKDGKVAANESVPAGTGIDDRIVAINRSPAYGGGMGNSLSYKSLRLSFFLSFKKKKGTSAIYGAPGSMNNISQLVYDGRWQYPGHQSDYQRLTTVAVTSDNQYTGSDAGWMDASYIRLQNVAIGYQLPQKMVRKAGMAGVSVNVTMQNIAVLSKFKGIDPEVTTFPSRPPMRTITAGLSFSF